MLPYLFSFRIFSLKFPAFISFHFYAALSTLFFLYLETFSEFVSVTRFPRWVPWIAFEQLCILNLTGLCHYLQKFPIRNESCDKENVYLFPVPIPLGHTVYIFAEKKVVWSTGQLILMLLNVSPHSSSLGLKLTPHADSAGFKFALFISSLRRMWGNLPC